MWAIAHLIILTNNGYVNLLVIQHKVDEKPFI